MDSKQIYHRVSYLQYPLMAVALFFVAKPYYDIFVLGDKETFFQNANSALIFMGLAISFSTLQDTNKTQNNLSKRIWESKKKGKLFLILMSVMTLLVIFTGIFGYLYSTNNQLEELSFGLIVLGIGMVGLVKTAMEMYDKHQNRPQSQ